MATPVILLNRIQLAENLGAIARVLKNFGFFELRLIQPQCDILDSKAIAVSAGAEDLLEHASIFSDIPTAIADLSHIWATCATERDGIKPYAPPEIACQQMYAAEKPGILFGPERTGLTNEEITRCQAVIQIPTHPTFTSLNIAQSVAVIGYEYSKQEHVTNSHLHMGETQLATQAQLTSFLHCLETNLDDTNYWRQPSKKAHMWRTIQNIFTRIELTAQEVQTLRGMIQRLRR